MAARLDWIWASGVVKKSFAGLDCLLEMWEEEEGSMIALGKGGWWSQAQSVVVGFELWGGGEGSGVRWEELGLGRGGLRVTVTQCLT